MPTDVEQSIELACAGQHVTQLVRVGPQGLVLVQEGRRDLVGFEHLDRGWVERCLAALGRGDGQLGLSLEDFVGVSEFGLDWLFLLAWFVFVVLLVRELVAGAGFGFAGCFTWR